MSASKSSTLSVSQSSSSRNSEVAKENEGIVVKNKQEILKMAQTESKKEETLIMEKRGRYLLQALGDNCKPHELGTKSVVGNLEYGGEQAVKMIDWFLKVLFSPFFLFGRSASKKAFFLCFVRIGNGSHALQRRRVPFFAFKP